MKRINIDTDDDGKPDTFIVQGANKGRLLSVDKDEDEQVDYLIILHNVVVSFNPWLGG